jgi:hypothetical protein
MGKYFAEMRTVSRLASYCASLLSWKRRLDDPHPRQALLEGREVLADAVAHQEIRLVRRSPEPAARDHDRGHDDERAERELPAHQEDHDDGAGEQQAVLHEHDQAHLHELLERLDVGGHAGDELAGLLALEEVHPQRHQVPEHVRTQVA